MYWNTKYALDIFHKMAVILTWSEGNNMLFISWWSQCPKVCRTLFYSRQILETDTGILFANRSEILYITMKVQCMTQTYFTEGCYLFTPLKHRNKSFHAVTEQSNLRLCAHKDCFLAHCHLLRNNHKQSCKRASNYDLSYHHRLAKALQQRLMTVSQQPSEDTTGWP